MRVPPSHAKVDPTAQCEAAKVAAIAKKLSAEASCYKKAIVKHTAVDPACLSKIEQSFAAAITKADKAGTCAGGAAELAGDADACIATVLGDVVVPTPTPAPTVTPTPTATATAVVGDTANSITLSTGSARTDPEGAAPPAASTSVITWKDARGADRTMTLGAYLYQYDFSFDDNLQTVSRSANDEVFGHAGFGWVVSQSSQNGNGPLGKANAPTDVHSTVFSGGHHAIHHVEFLYDRDKEPGGFGIKIPVVIEWLVATGRDHPVWSVTWKTGVAVNPANTDFDTYRMDVRGPYGSLNFDGAPSGGQGDVIGGVAWGDFGLSFTTTDSPLTLNSPWTYDTPNTVNFAEAWTATTNAEMGIVETRTVDKELGYPDRVVGHERGVTSAASFVGKGNCTAFSDSRTYVVPCVGGWAYQLMNFDWDPSSGKPASEATGTKVISLGTPYGWLGASNAELFDFSGTVDARGDRSFATFVVLGAHCRFNGGTCSQAGDVANTIQTVEALAAATIGNVTAGALVSQVPKGPGASETKTLANGYDDTYAAYHLSASGNQVAFTFAPAAGRPVTSPIFVIHGYNAAHFPQIIVAGTPVTVNDGTATSDTFVSLDTAANTLWVTLNRTLGAATDVQIAP